MNHSNFLANLGIDKLNEMQDAAISAIDEGADLTLLAKTGTGKTIAYLLPITAKLLEQSGQDACLVMVPSRELALQIEKTFRKLASGLKVLSCYGGHSIREEINSLKTNPGLIIGTPGRIAQHIEEKNFDEASLKYLVIDEFDKCLELGFLDDISFIYQFLPNLKQHVFTSATALDRLPDLIKLHNRRDLNFLDQSITKSQISTRIVRTNDRYQDLFNLLCFTGQDQTVVFATERALVEDIVDFLRHKGIQASIYHGKLEQDVRERELLKFANGSTYVLITTDLAGRGLDIPGVRHVIHFQLPINEQSFLHRNGRTARMNADGNVYVLLGNDEELKYQIENPVTHDLDDNHQLPAIAPWVTLYFSAGRKDKLSKGDLAGFLMKVGQLHKEQIGMIEVKDRASYVAVNRDVAQPVLEKIIGQKIKGKKIKIEIAK